ncbi:ATP-binding protein [Shumkonia mesophila]|uniref:ATP-binding protein n=1 Tax=Shumkonia mesophila TaxID=2838854 RepID=UPI00293517D8|nr:ATP-binding protein [Shumkonia mesophila]
MHILLAEDSPADALLIERAVSREFPGVHVRRAMNAEDFAAALGLRRWDIVLADHKPPTFSSCAAIEQLARSGRDIPLIVVSGAIGEEEAVDLLKTGAHDFVRKDNLGRLGPVLRRELADAGNRRRRREAEAALAEKERRLSTLMDNLPGMVFRAGIGPDLPMEFVSEGCREITGYDPQRLVGDGATSYRGAVVHADHRDFVRRGIEQAVRWNEPYQLTYRITRPSGETRWVWEKGRLVWLPHGGATAVEGFIADITERKAAEERVTELQSRLMGASRLMLMGELATGIAHEVKQPLSAIRIYAEGLAEQTRAGGAVGPDLAPILDRIVDQNRKAQAVIDRILAFVRRAAPRMSDLDVNQTVRDAVKFFEVEAGDANVHLNLSLAPDVPPVVGDAVQIQQVIVNLLHNGLDAVIEAAVPRGELRVETAKAADGGVDVAVTDNGPGIPQAVIARAFIPFFTTKPDGFGLGLTICSKVVEDHGGRLSIDAPAGGGTVARFHLPPRP